MVRKRAAVHADMSVVALPRTEPQATFEWVPPDAISDVWDMVRDGIEEVARHGDHWRPEDVYMALRQGQANLHIAYVDGRYSGLIVAMSSRAYDGPILHVWAVYAVPGMPRLRRECYAKLQEFARNMQARRIIFTSPRRGWERVGRLFGFKPALTIFECEVEP